MKCGVFDCLPAHHVACAVCGRDVCLGGLSDYQRARVLWRAKASGRPVVHFGCAQKERAAA